ncbi:hypothetical protein JHK86_009890 [Glycine max]|nr:hypothetical protein JHK86_009890 [Glycine max]
MGKRGVGRPRIQAETRRKGVERKIITQATVEIEELVGEIEGVSTLPEENCINVDELEIPMMKSGEELKPTIGHDCATKKVPRKKLVQVWKPTKQTEETLNRNKPTETKAAKKIEEKQEEPQKEQEEPQKDQEEPNQELNPAEWTKCDNSLPVCYLCFNIVMISNLVFMGAYD